jgi:hypothetical protein
VNTERLELKWGSLKSWHFREDNAKANELLNKWASLGYSMSAAMQHDTPEQKAIICELIDLGDFETVYLSWDAKDVSKDEAKRYVMEYGQKKPSSSDGSAKP